MTSALLAEGKTISDRLKSMRRIADTMRNESFLIELSRPSGDFALNSLNKAFAFGLALLLISLILATHFRA